MSAHFVLMLAASQPGVTPNPPEEPSIGYYGASLVQVNWENANGGTKYTRVYRSSGGWSLLNTLAPGVGSYATGDSAASGYTYGVSHYDPATGLESAIVRAGTATATPNSPTSPATFHYGPGLTKIGIGWVNAESLPVRCYRNSVLITTQIVGATAWESGYTSGVLEVSHYNPATGQESAKVGGV